MCSILCYEKNNEHSMQIVFLYHSLLYKDLKEKYLTNTITKHVTYQKYCLPLKSQVT